MLTMAVPAFVVNEDEAARVRGLFEAYLETQSLSEAIKIADARKWTNKEQIPTLFHWNAVLIVSDGVQARFGDEKSDHRHANGP